MRYTDITLIKQVDERNEFEDLVQREVRRTVYAGEYSVGMSETYQAMAVGYKPEVKFILQSWLDYQGEELVEYVPFGSKDQVRLRVLRTFNSGDTIELTCYRDNKEV